MVLPVVLLGVVVLAAAAAGARRRRRRRRANECPREPRAARHPVRQSRSTRPARRDPTGLRYVQPALENLVEQEFEDEEQGFRSATAQWLDDRAWEEDRI